MHELPGIKKLVPAVVFEKRLNNEYAHDQLLWQAMNDLNVEKT
jgi:hypothetical protein